MSTADKWLIGIVIGQSILLGVLTARVSRIESLIKLRWTSKR